MHRRARETPSPPGSAQAFIVHRGPLPYGMLTLPSPHAASAAAFAAAAASRFAFAAAAFSALAFALASAS